MIVPERNGFLVDIIIEEDEEEDDEEEDEEEEEEVNNSSISLTEEERRLNKFINSKYCKSFNDKETLNNLLSISMRGEG